MACRKGYVRGLSENYPGFRFSNSVHPVPPRSLLPTALFSRLISNPLIIALLYAFDGSSSFYRDHVRVYPPPRLRCVSLLRSICSLLADLRSGDTVAVVHCFPAE
jgi:hypothetical protein